MGCISIAIEPRKHQRLKHIDVKYMHIREAVENGIIHIQYIPNTDQLADVYTKGLSADIFEKFVNIILNWHPQFIDIYRIFYFVH